MAKVIQQNKGKKGKRGNKKRAAKTNQPPVDAKQVEVDLRATVELLHQHLTESLCQAVFARERTTERQREWTLQALADFWTEVILRAPASLTQALEECAAGRPGWPAVAATPEAFFQRARDLHWRFFRALYADFVQRILGEADTNYGSDMAELRPAFLELWIVDGSRLDAIWHRLKLLHTERAVVLPGCLEVAYDLWRGIPRLVQFCPDAARAEMKRVLEMLPQIPEGTLILGDRLHANVKLFAALTEQQKWGVFRRNRQLSLRKRERLSKEWVDGGKLEDWLVQAGSGQTAPPQTLRYICYTRPGVRYELLTNVLDPKKLSALQAINLYPERWTVERLFFDLKDVLNLHCFYAANPNAVAMQVYAAALVYTAMRIAQGRLAREQGLLPEAISPAKLFPRVAATSFALVTAEQVYQACCQANPGRGLRRPDLRQLGIGVVKLANILVEKRSEKRRRRRFCRSRKRWKSLAHVKGGKKFTAG